jgi:hypothetical protein
MNSRIKLSGLIQLTTQHNTIANLLNSDFLHFKFQSCAHHVGGLAHLASKRNCAKRIHLELLRCFSRQKTNDTCMKIYFLTR